MSDPIILAPGQDVPGPGQFIMSMDDYHRQCCPGPSFSSSGLRTIYHQSPADFWAFSDLNDNRFERESTEAFTFGRAAHALLLGDEDFNAKFIVLPKVAPPKPTSAQISARVAGRVSDSAEERFEFWDKFEAMAEGREILSETDLIHIEHIHDRLREHDIAQILLEGQAEQSLIWQDERTGLWIKSRLDVLSATGDLADLKSTIQSDPRMILRDVQKYGLDMQLGLGTIALEQVLGIPFTPETYEARSAILLFIQKKPPYSVTPVELTYDALQWGRLKIRKAIDTAAECIRNDRWPSPVEGIMTYDTPAWEVERIAEQQAAGLFPVSV